VWHMSSFGNPGRSRDAFPIRDVPFIKVWLSSTF
jgi:hypothetical protein